MTLENLDEQSSEGTFYKILYKQGHRSHVVKDISWRLKLNNSSNELMLSLST